MVRVADVSPTPAPAGGHPDRYGPSLASVRCVAHFPRCSESRDMTTETSTASTCRPVVSGRARLDVPMNFRLPHATHARLVAAAGKSGMTVAGFLRSLIAARFHEPRKDDDGADNESREIAEDRTS